MNDGATVMMRLFAVLLLTLAAGGCASVAVTLAGLGAGIGANHLIGNVTHRTFTAPMPEVKFAALGALKRMAFEIDAIETTDKSGELIRAKTAGREVEIELEPLSPTATRVRSLVRLEGGLTLDGATASEIVAQTERGLQARPETVLASVAPAAASRASASDVRGLASVAERDAGAIIADQENLKAVPDREVRALLARESKQPATRAPTTRAQATAARPRRDAPSPTSATAATATAAPSAAAAAAAIR